MLKKINLAAGHPQLLTCLLHLNPQENVSNQQLFYSTAHPYRTLTSFKMHPPSLLLILLLCTKKPTRQSNRTQSSKLPLLHQCLPLPCACIINKQQQMHSKTTTRTRLQQFKRHKKYLNRIKCTSLYCPRYDMLSLSNNLLLHRNFDPKLDLVPKKQSQEVAQLQQQITSKKMNSKPQQMEKANWFEEIINKDEVSQGKFKVKYEPVGYEIEKVRNQLNKLYNTSRGSFSHGKSRNLTVYDQLPKLGSFLK